MRPLMIFTLLLLGLLFTLDSALAQDWGLVATQKQESRLILEKSAPLIVAVIDTGTDLTHPSLKGRAWKNPGESGFDKNGRNKSSNGVDDDGNGFIDDASGWNFAGNNNDLSDNHGHGTHITGIINSVSPGVRFMVLKYYDPKARGQDNLKALIEAIRYATRMKADVINYSGGGFVPSLHEKFAIQEAAKKGILFVAAAGNESSNSDIRPFYPADYRLSNILSVGAHDQRSALLPQSNYGLQSVQIAAPGDTILSALPNGVWGPMSGTSQATAFVTGAACLLKTQRPDFSALEVIRHLRNTARFEPGLSGKVASSGRLNMRRALASQERGRSVSGYRLANHTVLRNEAAPKSRLAAQTPLQ